MASLILSGIQSYDLTKVDPDWLKLEPAQQLVFLPGLTVEKRVKIGLLIQLFRQQATLRDSIVGLIEHEKINAKGLKKDYVLSKKKISILASELVVASDKLGCYRNNNARELLARDSYLSRLVPFISFQGKNLTTKEPDLYTVCAQLSPKCLLDIGQAFISLRIKNWWEVFIKERAPYTYSEQEITTAIQAARKALDRVARELFATW